MITSHWLFQFHKFHATDVAFIFVDDSLSIIYNKICMGILLQRASLMSHYYDDVVCGGGRFVVVVVFYQLHFFTRGKNKADKSNDPKLV